MRIDKYLWAIRVFKTRKMAADSCKSNLVKINGKPMKASKIISIGVCIYVQRGEQRIEVKVIDFPKNRVGAPLVEDFSTVTFENPDKLNIHGGVIRVNKQFKGDRHEKEDRRISKRQRRAVIESKIWSGR